MDRQENAYVVKSDRGNRWQVRHGGTGRLLESFKSRDKAEAHMRKLHKKHKPKKKHRGSRARRRLETNPAPASEGQLASRCRVG